jgi:ribonucleotide reductase alpha subunit
MNLLLQERLETGRIYIQNLDNANTHSGFIDKINMSNLCQEINLPTSPIYDIQDGKTVKRKIKISKKDYDKFLKIKGDRKEIYIKPE